MIIIGGSRSNWRFFAKHLTNERDNGYVQVAEMRGLLAENVQEALREMDAIASGTRCKNAFYHAAINPRPGEHLTPEQWGQAVDALERNLHLAGHARFVVEHEKDGRTHRHVIWSRIDPDTMKAVSDSFTARAHEITSRELESAFGLEPVESVLVADRDHERSKRGPKAWETFRGHRSGITPQEVTTEVTELWNSADTGTAFAAALADHGYILCKGDRRDFCIIDAAGNEHSLARRIEGQRAAQIRARMADIDKDTLPSVAEGRELANARNEDVGLEAVDSQQAAPDRSIEAAIPQEVPSEPEPVETAPEAAGPQAVGFWGKVAGYASRVLSTMRGEPVRSAWSVEECRDFLRSDEPGSGVVRSVDSYAEPLEDAIREHGAIPTRDGQTWWQRASQTIGATIDNATTWAKTRWSSFTDRIEHERAETNDPDMEL